MNRAKKGEVRPVFRVVKVGEQRIVLRTRRAPGSMRCCGPVAVALAMVAGFALFAIMQGYEGPGARSSYQCLPLGIGTVALALTVINLLELVQCEELVFDAVDNAVFRRESFVPNLLYITRWSVPFSRIREVSFRKIRGGTSPPPVWGVFLVLFDDQAVRVDRSSDQEKIFALANYLTDFLRVKLVE